MKLEHGEDGGWVGEVVELRGEEGYDARYDRLCCLPRVPEGRRLDSPGGPPQCRPGPGTPGHLRDDQDRANFVARLGAVATAGSWNVCAWEGIAALRRGRERWAAGERILGSGPLVDHVLHSAVADRPPWPRARALAALPAVLAACSTAWGVAPAELQGGSRGRPVAHARAAVSAPAVTHLGLSAAIVARTLGVTQAVVLRGVARGPQLLAGRGLDPGRLLAAVKKKV